MCVIPGRGCMCGVVGCMRTGSVLVGAACGCVSRSGVESPTGVGESPVYENMFMCGCVCSRVAAGSWNLL